MNAPVSVPKEWNRLNEVAFRNYLDSEFADTHRKSSDLIIPYGFRLGFVGATGSEVAFELNSSDQFAITVNGDTAITFASSGDLSALNLSLTALVEEVDDKLQGSVALTLDVNGRAASFKLLSDGTTSDIIFKADTFQFFDGVSDRPVFLAEGGLITINADLQVEGAILVGSARLNVALESLEFQKIDGDAVLWKGGVSIGTAPAYTLDISALNPLASGEQYDVRLTDVTDIGATVRAKILTPGATATQTETTDTAGGGGDPDRIMTKPTTEDSYNGTYTFEFSGTMTINGVYTGTPGRYVNNGSLRISTWFNDGSGWDEGPTIVLTPTNIDIPSIGPDNTGAAAFTIDAAVNWSAPIGSSAAYEFGLSHESGGSLTDFVSITYVSQAFSGERTASPNGEQLKISAFPRNAA